MSTPGLPTARQRALLPRIWGEKAWSIFTAAEKVSFRALERRGYVELFSNGQQTRVRLTDRGRQLAARERRVHVRIAAAEITTPGGGYLRIVSGEITINELAIKRDGGAP